MINQVSNNVIINAPTNSTNAAVTQRALPSVNSIVNVSVLEKLAGTYKI